MISKDEILELILTAAPSFKSTADSELASKEDGIWFDDKGEMLNYIMLGDFARHIIEQFQRGHTDEFGAIFEMIEKLERDGDSFVKEAATIGLLEGIQNVSLNNNVDPTQFEQFLKPETMKWWQYLNDFWEGKKPKKPIVD